MDRGQRLRTIAGSPPDLSALPPGCTFAPRCPHAQAQCLESVPRSVALGGGHRVSCVLPAEPAAVAEAVA
jgi:peptide/nickel transport system ATP-binding protein